MPKCIPGSEITPERVFSDRRHLLRVAGQLSILGLGWTSGAARAKTTSVDGHANASRPRTTPRSLFTQYNNFYEFGWDKSSPSQLGPALKTTPWTLRVEGLCERPLTLDLDALTSRFAVKEHIRRFRCVEGWSAVVPWQGISLAELLNAAAPLSSARFVRFTAVMQPESLPSQKENKLLVWPYVEALRMDEALHPLTLLATGMYGATLPPQNGAPLRLVVPWKYGFKSIKSVVKIELIESQPMTSWVLAAPEDYGFYANVNPDVPHPRWSQSSERPLGDPFYAGRRATELFNGYAEEVASLYQGLDLHRNY